MCVDYVVNFLNSSPSRFLRHSVMAAIAYITDIVLTKGMLFAPSVEKLITQLNNNFGFVISHLIDQNYEKQNCLR